jgi:hypothetical protein
MGRETPTTLGITYRSTLRLRGLRSYKSKELIGDTRHLPTYSSSTCAPPWLTASPITMTRETKDNRPYLQSGRLSEPIFKLYNTLPIRNRLTVISIRIIFPIKLPEKLLIRLQSLPCVRKSYLAPLLSRKSLSYAHDILDLNGILVRRRPGFW